MSRLHVVAVALAIVLLACVLVGAWSSRVTGEVRQEMPGEVVP